MVVQLGKNPWLLIGLIFIEALFVLAPAFISSKIEKKSFKELLSEMGFRKNEDIYIKIIVGLNIGIIFFFFGDLLILFIRNIIIENIFGSRFIQEGQEGAITTMPIQPNVIQIIILILLQIIIIGPCEEAFFRGFLINKIKSNVKIPYLITISSIIFAFYHVPPFLVPLTTIITYFGYYFIFGVLLALIFIYFDYSLIPCTITHSLFNILLLLI
ncbi:MAG: CPBP family intramembrane metalloprotease [Candidatus Lokiarchaeota archaeon]|nr:CPBP family intramembrane metalloprotease [Candidatus Lokiarchaeota archaeon]